MTFTLPSAPPGASLNPPPLLDWTPTPGEIGPYKFTATVTDSHGGRVNEFSVTVQYVDHPPQLAPQADESVGIGTTFIRTLSATDPDAGDTLTYSLVGGPSGMILNGAHVAWATSGVSIGAYPVTVKVTDASGLSDTKSFTLNLLPLVTPVAVDDSYSVHLGATLNPGPGVLANDLGPVGAVSRPPRSVIRTRERSTPSAPMAVSVIPLPHCRRDRTFARAQVGHCVRGRRWRWLQHSRVADVFGNGKPVIFVAHAPANSTGVTAVDGTTGASLVGLRRVARALYRLPHRA